MVLIDGARCGFLEPMLRGHRIGVSASAYGEVFYWKDEAGCRHDIDLRPFVDAGLLEIVGATADELIAALAKASSGALGAGELESMALVIARDDQFCTADHLAMRTMKRLGLKKSHVALGDLLSTLDPPIEVTDDKYRTTMENFDARQRVHVVAGAVSGAGFAAYRSAGQPSRAQFLETVGGGVGGAIGGRLPDMVEPPHWPGHRGPAHSLTALALVGAIGYHKLGDWQEAVRRCADRCAGKRAACEPESFLALAWRIAEVALRFIAGLIAGVMAGYVSHLALDAFTPAGMAPI